MVTPWGRSDYFTREEGARISAHHQTVMCSSATYCTALYYTALHCTALHCTTLHCTVHRWEVWPGYWLIAYREVQGGSSATLTLYCTLFQNTAHCALCSVHCAQCPVQCALCTVPCAVCSVHSAVCSVQCAVCSVQCAGHNAQLLPVLVLL